MRIPESVMNLLNDPEAKKTLTSVSKEGIPHTIVVGSMMAANEETLCAAEVGMGITSENLKNNINVAVLAVKDREAYLVNGSVRERQTEGELFNKVDEKLSSLGLNMKGLWLFNPVAVYDESAGPNGGTKLA